ncbi:MAG: sulfatase-like hydrolase/transferase, partial [Planctomycetota bacterium]
MRATSLINATRPIRTNAWYFSVFICLLSSSLCLDVRAAKDLPPNFVVLLTDDQSWVGSSIQIDSNDHRTRSDYFSTPNLERLAESGMRFTRGYAPAPFCCPTRRSLQIGQTPARHIYQRDQRSWTSRYRRELTLPQMLKRSNSRYTCAHFGKWDMRFDEITPKEMGYDVSDGYTDNSTGGG